MTESRTRPGCSCRSQTRSTRGRRPGEIATSCLLTTCVWPERTTGLPSAKQTRGYPEKGPLRIPFILAMQGDGDASQRFVGLLVWRSGRRFRRTRYPDPSVGDRHAVTLEVVAPADITNVPLDGRGFLIDGRVGRIHIRIGVIVGVGIKRVCERCCHEDPAEEGGRETAVVEAVVVKPVV